MRLVEFLTKVVTDDGWRERFCDDPGATIRRAELSERAMKALRSGDPDYVGYVICTREGKRGNGFDPVD